MSNNNKPPTRGGFTPMTKIVDPNDPSGQRLIEVPVNSLHLYQN